MGPFLSAVHLLLALVVPVSVGLCLCASRVASFSWCCGALLFRCCCSVFCCGCCLFVGCPCGLVLAVWPALFRSPSPCCLLVVSGPVSVLLVPPSGYLVVSATVQLSYLWYGVSWLIGSCLHSAPWQQKLRPCVGLCPLHHVVGLVHVFLAPSLRYSPSCDPVYLRTPLKLHAPPPWLVLLSPFCPAASRASALSFLAGLRLSPSPRALFLLGFVCPPCGPLSWLVLVAPPSVCFWFVLLAWPVLWFVWFRCVFRPWLVLCLCFAVGGFSSRHTGQVRSYILISLHN